MSSSSSHLLTDWHRAPLIENHASPKLQSECKETHITHQDCVGLYDDHDEQVPAWQICTAFLTSHRIVLVDVAAGSALGLCLSKVKSTSFRAGFGMWSRPKIRLHINPTSTTRTTTEYTYMLSFRNGGCETFQPKVNVAIAKLGLLKPFQSETTTTTTTTTAQRAVRSQSVGVGQVICTAAAKHQTTSDIVKSAFADMTALEACIQDVLQVCRETAAAQKQRNISDANLNACDGQLQDALISLGIEDVVVANSTSSSSNFTTALSRELESWLSRALPKFGNVMTLHDVYALYNRSRGRDMVSPQDVADAVKLIQKEQQQQNQTSACVVRTLTSNQILIQSTDFQTRFQQVVFHDMLPPDKLYDVCISDVALANKIGVSVALARELLVESENRLELCRYESIKGIEFYRNFFLHPTSAS
eukprot:PhM_4_TR18635/c0_g1_i1/m.54793/K12190/VPS36, EAP45; ESCRT-II complex subunit VPS36